MIYHSGSHDLDGLPEIVETAVATLKPHKQKFDSIAVIGVSGLVVGSPVALALGKPLVIVRKPDTTERSHSYGAPVNMKHVGKRALFLDDFIASGSTRENVSRVVREAGARLVGDYTYGEAGDDYNPVTFEYTRLPKLAWDDPGPPVVTQPRKRKSTVLTYDSDALLADSSYTDIPF